MTDSLQERLRAAAENPSLDICDAWILLAAAADRIDSLMEEHLAEQRKSLYADMLLWRGIDLAGGDVPCKACSGSGVRTYGSTATWHGGAGGQALTTDICDRCWGSGNQKKPWLNLRRLQAENEAKMPEGYALVPVEPTVRMVIHGVLAAKYYEQPTTDMVEDCWRAMISAEKEEQE